jgi:predicted O-methyltransferase YrrM
MKSKTQNPNHTTLDGLSSLDEYVLSHIDTEPEYLHRLWRATNVHMLHGRMASGHLQGRLLKMFVKMVNPLNVIEVGTFSGYSALCMAEGLSGEGHLYTFEINDEQEPFTRKWIEESPWADRITFIIGDAASEAKKIGKRFDLAFLDGDKRTYVETYEALLPLMNKGGFILADNTLWDGHVTEAEYDNDRQTVGIRRFNDYITSDQRVEKVILPLRDGLTIIRVKSEE